MPTGVYPRPVLSCSVEGCTRKHLALGLCGVHYKRARNGTSSDKPIRVRGQHNICTVADCARPVSSHGLCEMHARRVAKTGDLQLGSCTRPDCSRPTMRDGLCNSHYFAELYKSVSRRTYTSWFSMLLRCYNPTNDNFRYYGGRGVSVCERWRESVLNFAADMGERPAGTSLDRIDPDGNYEPSNCRWATAKEQRANRRS